MYATKDRAMAINMYEDHNHFWSKLTNTAEYNINEQIVFEVRFYFSAKRGKMYLTYIIFHLSFFTGVHKENIIHSQAIMITKWNIPNEFP